MLIAKLLKLGLKELGQKEKDNYNWLNKEKFKEFQFKEEEKNSMRLSSLKIFQMSKSVSRLVF